MPHVQAIARLSVDADTVWQRVGSFQRVAWHPMLASVEGQGEEPGAVRKPRSRDGQEQTEKLLETSASNHFLRYAIVSTPLPVKDWIGELRVTDNGDGTSMIAWMGDFSVDPKEEAKAVGTIQTFLDTGVDALRKEYSFAPPR